jgi:hypothetical protein
MTRMDVQHAYFSQTEAPVCGAHAAGTAQGCVTVLQQGKRLLQQPARGPEYLGLN